MSYLFLDANILLDFYRYGADDLQEISKLSALIEDGDVTLLTNSQLRNETQRMRERVLSDSFSELKAGKQQIKVPNYCKQLPELLELQEALKKANKAHGRLVEAAQAKILSSELDADILIGSMFDKSADLTVGGEALDAAKLRVALGNPPGKQGMIGDAISWETLLAATNVKRLDFVSRDGDFESELEPGKMKSFLTSEWKENKKKHSHVTLFKSLSEYFKKRYPKIKLSEETRKRELIEKLRTSPNFSTTHSAIEELNQFEYFTGAQIGKLFEILTDNSQVGWIGTDDDVKDFYNRFQEDAWLLPTNIQEAAKERLEVDDDFFSPF